jgi:hypothetical protein
MGNTWASVARFPATAESQARAAGVAGKSILAARRAFGPREVFIQSMSYGSVVSCANLYEL